MMWCDCSVTAGLCALALSLFIIFYRKRQHEFRIFRDMCIPGPEPHWLYGNYHELHKPLLHEVIRKWTRQYGKIFGYFDGPRPVLVTSDPDFIKEVFVKRHSSFSNRKGFYITPRPNGKFNHMFNATGQRWKRLRTIINPTFSSIKLKQMLPLVDAKVNVLMEKLTTSVQTDEPINIMELYQGLTMDVIADVAFGVQIDCINNQNEPFLVNSRRMFDGLAPAKHSIVIKAAALFPELGILMYNMYQFLMRVTNSPPTIILNGMDDVIHARQQQQTNRTDLLQIMLDAKAENLQAEDATLAMTAADDDKQDKSCDEAEKTSPQPAKMMPNFEKKLTHHEIKSQCFLFLIAGYETTSTALSYCTHLLATNPDKQQLLLDEIDLYTPQGTSVSYEVLQKMTYLHMCLCETLRLYPLGSNVVTRQCSEACTVLGVDIPVGMYVMSDSWTVHHNPDIWGQDTDHFIPERFSKEASADRHPMAWLPFGVGPRNCVGLRFALIEAKLALAKILQKYSFQKCDATEEVIQLKEVGVIVPANGIKVKLLPRF